MIIYIIIGLVWLLFVFSFYVWIEKMIKIILWNYILWSICLAASQSIDFLIDFFATSPNLKFLGMTYDSLWKMFFDWKTIIVLVLYVVLLVVIYRTSKIRISVPQDQMIQKWLYFLFVPLTVLSIVLTFQIAVMWVSAINIKELQGIAAELTTNSTIYSFITMTPVWILLHWIATILITSEMKIWIKTAV